MIDATKWENCTDAEKKTAIRIIKTVMDENKVTKADTKLITDFCVGFCEEE